jgi:hypothetical protein
MNSILVSLDHKRRRRKVGVGFCKDTKESGLVWHVNSLSNGVFILQVVVALEVLESNFDLFEKIEKLTWGYGLLFFSIELQLNQKGRRIHLKILWVYKYN